MVSSKVEFLLCNASYYGTLAAVRSLGRAGIPVVTVGPELFACSRYSRYAQRHLNCPPFEQTEEWVGWLLELARSGPRRAIYATSDAVSFALARYCDDIGAAFDLYQPNLEAVMGILDKGLLLQHAKAVGMGTPDTWVPQSVADAVRIMREVGGKIVIKPRTQLAIKTYTKGTVIDTDATDGRVAYERLLAPGAHDAEFARQHPEIMFPLLQRFLPQAMDKVLSVSGFCDISGTHFVTRGAHKVLQQPRQLGIGLCFEEASVSPSLAQNVADLCRRIGYYGAFELEFIDSAQGPLLIDFNGRFYNQLAFDVGRGLDLPGLVYAGATGGPDAVARMMGTIQKAHSKGDLAFSNSFGLSAMFQLQKALGRISDEEVTRWRDWHALHEGRMIDAVSDTGDPVPVYIDRLKRSWNAIRHPRGFVLNTVLASDVRSVRGKRSRQTVTGKSSGKSVL
jgi:D-aspartate ligase